MIQGNTYLKEVTLTGNNDVIVRDTDVLKVQFIFDKYEKFYYANEESECYYNSEKECFVVPFSEEETFNLSGQTIKIQARVLFIDNSIDATLINYDVFNPVLTETRLIEQEVEI